MSMTGESAAEALSAKVTADGSAADVATTDMAATDVAHSTTHVATTHVATAAHVPTAAAACQCIRRNNGASQRNRRNNDRDLVQHRVLFHWTAFLFDPDVIDRCCCAGGDASLSS
jgi:hypothetical protein